MKFLENYNKFDKKTKKDTYMFSNIYEDDHGNLIGYCKFCDNGVRVDIAEHTNVCPNVPKPSVKNN